MRQPPGAVNARAGGGMVVLMAASTGGHVAPIEALVKHVAEVSTAVEPLAPRAARCTIPLVRVALDFHGCA